MKFARQKGFRLTLALVAALIVAAVAAGAAQASLFKLETFKTSIDVKLNLTEHSMWNGIQPGCFAPQEKFDMTYQMRVDSTPSRRSDIRNGTTTLSNLAYGTTPAYGDKRSFNQYSSSAPWELQVQNPASCNTETPQVPAWATSPTCKKAYNRVEASLLMTSEAKKGDGSLVLNRISRIGRTSGTDIGASCFRTLHEIKTEHLDTALAIDTTHTMAQLPIPDLEAKLERISRGSARSHPSFKVNFRISNTCNNMGISPSTGEDSNFLVGLTSTPHQALGTHNGDPARSTCTISGFGTAIVRREGRVQSTRVNR